MQALVLFASLVFSAVSNLTALTADKPKPAAGWMTDYAQARQIARQTGKPMFIVFR